MEITLLLDQLGTDQEITLLSDPLGTDLTLIFIRGDAREQKHPKKYTTGDASDLIHQG